MAFHLSGAYWLPGLAVAHAAGILLADWVPLPPGAAWTGAATALVVAVARPGRTRSLAVLLTAALSGAAALGARLEAAAGGPVLPRTLTVEATVERAVRAGSRFRLDLRGVSAAHPVRAALPERVRLHGELHGGPADALASAPPGRVLRLAARLRRPHGPRNPGGRDVERLLARRGIGAEGRLVHPSLWAARTEAPLRRGGWRAARSRAARRLEATGEGGPLLAALALGERGALPPATRDAFARLGLAHLLAVSGLHLTLVGAMAYAAARFLLVRSVALSARHDVRRVALALAVAAAGAYAVASGLGTPVRRAWVLLAAAALGLAAGRPRRRAHPLAAAALWILGREPAALFSPGAQLSFAATAALLAAAPGPVRSDPLENAAPGPVRSDPLENAAPGPVRSDPLGNAAPAVRPGGRTAARLRTAVSLLAGSVRTTATALLATTPLVAWHWGRLDVAGLAANAVAVPWTALALLPASGAAALAASLPPASALEAVLGGAEALARASLHAVHAAADRLPVLAPAPRPSPLVLGSAAALAGIALRGGLRARLAGLALIHGLLWTAPSIPVRPTPERAVFLDVGQGDATLVQGRRAALLVDAGARLPGGTDRGRTVVVPALRALGVQRLDVLALTHGDLDHRGGGPAVLASLPVREVWLPAGGRGDPAFAGVLAAAAAREVPVRERAAGDAASRHGDLLVETLWPPRARAAPSENDGSLVLRVTVAGRRVLLAADVERNAERRLLARGTDLRADVLKLSHHGSASSSSHGFLAAVAPRWAVASAPCGGRWAMPHASVVERLRENGVRLAWTGRDGAILVGLGPQLVVRSWRDQRLGCGRRVSAGRKEGDSAVSTQESR